MTLSINDKAGAAPQGGPRPVVYATPEDRGKGKTIVMLGKTDLMRAAVQVVTSGGETNLHAHTGMDLLYFVLKGRVRFYGENDVVLGEFGAHEGVMLPRGTPYWFESAGAEKLELLQVGAFDKSVDNRRIDHAERVRDLEDTPIIDASS